MGSIDGDHSIGRLVDSAAKQGSDWVVDLCMSIPKLVTHAPEVQKGKGFPWRTTNQKGKLNEIL